MLPRSCNRNEKLSSLNGGGKASFVEPVEGSCLERESGANSFRNSVSNRHNTNSKLSKTSDNLNNNKNNLAKSPTDNKSYSKYTRPHPSESDVGIGSTDDIVNDFDLVSAIPNYKPTSTTQTTTTFKPLIQANTNNPTETFNLNPILFVTNQMTDTCNKNSNNTNVNAKAGGKGKLIETTTTTSAMKTLNGTSSPAHLRQNHVTASAPNTPEALRKAQLLLRHRASDLTSSPATMMMMSSHPPPASSAKHEKMEFNQMMMKMNYEKELRPLSYHGKSADSSYPNSIMSSPVVVNKRHVGSSGNGRNRKETALMNRRSMPSPYLENRLREKFDVSELDTNLPRIDLEAIENHLKLARDEDRKRRTDREEIRRRLALESDEINDKPGGRKPSLHSRLQSSMNLQICFMNETASDSESPGSDTEIKNSQPPASLPCQVNKVQSGNVMDGNGVSGCGISSEDFYTKQARLQADARRALSQAKDLARLQMTQEKERRLQSPITEMVRNSLQKVGVTLPNERRRVSRQLLTELNVAQLQVIVNDLHSHIEVLNETLVSMLLERDDLHMEQDSMLVDIEDLTRYLAAKDNSPHQSLPLIQSSKSLLGKK